MVILLTACGAVPPAEPPMDATPVVALPAPPPPVPPATCPATTAELPPSPRFAAEDPRLSADDLVVVFKQARRAGRYDGGKNVGCWPIALAMDGGGDRGHKEREGDLRTPEGWYRTSDRPESRYYHAILLHYPNVEDADEGLAKGTIDGATRDAIVDAIRGGEVPPQTTALGSYLLFHGGGSRSDWTLGCVAFEDADIDALRAELPAGMRTWALLLP